MNNKYDIHVFFSSGNSAEMWDTIMMPSDNGFTFKVSKDEYIFIPYGSIEKMVVKESILKEPEKDES